MNVWKDSTVTTNFLVLDINSIVFLSYLFQIWKIFITFLSALICDSCKILGNDLNLPSEIYGKNDNEFLEKSDMQEHLNEEDNGAAILNGRLKGNVFRMIIVNLSKRKLSKSETSLLYKNLKSIPTSNTTDKVKRKIVLEAFGTMLLLKSFFWNDEEVLDHDKFKPKSVFNPRNKDAGIEIYLGSLEE